MATGGGGEFSFEVNPDIAGVLELLRGTGLQWIADEVERRIREGTVERDTFQVSQRKRKTYEAVRGLSEAEQTAVLLTAIRDYIFLPWMTWPAAEASLIDSINQSKNESRTVAAHVTAVEIVPPGDDVAPISVTNSNADGSLRKAWTELQPYMKRLGIATE